MTSLKIVFVGDDAVGKISFATKIVKGKVLVQKSNVNMNFVHNVLVDDLQVMLNIWLTSSSEVYDNIRHEAYNDANIIMICYAVDDPKSFENVKIKWNKEIEKNSSKCAKGFMKILVGLKIDLRSDKEALQRVKDEYNLQNLYTAMEGREMASLLGRNCGYVECSTQSGEGIEDVFKESIRLYFNRGMTLTSTELAYIQTRKQTKFSNFSSKKWNRKKKVVFVGDNFSGKSALVGAIVGRKFSTEHHDNETLDVAEWNLWDNAISESESHSMTKVTNPPKFQIWDAPTGKKGYSKYSSSVRRLCYTFCDAVVIVFALNEERTKALDRIKKKWVPEILRHVSGFIIDERKSKSSYRYVRYVPIFLVGTKVDIRDEYDEKRKKIINDEETEGEEDDDEDEDFYKGKFVSRSDGVDFAKENNLFVHLDLFEDSDVDTDTTPSSGRIYQHAYVECSGKSKKGVDDVISKLNSVLYGRSENPDSPSTPIPSTPSTPLPSKEFMENKRSRVFKLRESLRKRERAKWKIVTKMHDMVGKLHFTKKQQQSGASGKTSGAGGTLISKLRKDVKKLEMDELERFERIKRRMLAEMKQEIKISKVKLEYNKKQVEKLFECFGKRGDVNPLKIENFVEAFMGFKKMNQSRLEMLRSNFVQRQKRFTFTEITNLQERLTEIPYQDLLCSVAPDLPSPADIPRASHSARPLSASLTSSGEFSNVDPQERERGCMLRVEGKDLVTVQSFDYETSLKNLSDNEASLRFLTNNSQFKKSLYFGECIIDEKNGNIIPCGEGYLYKGYGGGKVGGLIKKKQHKNYGIIFNGYFDGETGIITQKGMELDLKTGKTVYEGQYNSDGLREGIGVEYDLKKFQCRKGVWKKGKLVEEQRCFEFGMISFSEIESQLLPKNELGRGGNATVYEVMWKGVSRAAKIMSIPAHAGTGNNNLTYNVILRSVRNNLSLLAPLNFRHIIKLYGMIEGRRKVGYMMEKCVCDVNSIIRKENCSFKEKIRILFETAQGMKFLHFNQVMNRDLKWSNVLVDSTGRVVLTDLDTAREDETIWRNNVQNTASSIGTPVFIAPELMSRKYDKRIDVYSFGIMIFSLVFDLVNPFAETLECPGCKCKIPTLNTYAFPTHVNECGLRPLIDFQKQNSLKDDEKWVIDLMRVCWENDPNRRPSFEEIVFILQSKLNSLEDKIIRVTVKGSSLYQMDKIILMRKTVDSLREKIQSRYPNKKIKKLYLFDSKQKTEVDLSLLKSSDSENNNQPSRNSLMVTSFQRRSENDSEFERMIMKEEDPLILVEFEKGQNDEDDNSQNALKFDNVEDAVVKLRKEMKEKKEIEVKYERIRKENEELKLKILEMEKKMKEMIMGDEKKKNT